MNIGIDASRALRTHPTGTERYSLEIIRHLLALPEAAQHKWRLYINQEPANKFLSDYREVANIEFILLPAKRLWTHRTLAREILRDPPDVLFIPSHVIPFILPIDRLPPSVVTIHDLGYHYFPQAHTRFQRHYLEWSTRWSATAATELIAISQATANDLQKFYQTPATKIHTIHEALPPRQPSRPQPQPNPHPRPYALYVSTIQPRKNLARLMQAYAKVHTGKKPTWDLILVGGRGWLSETLYEQVAALQLREHIHFPGYVPDEALPGLFENALFFCYPSLFEGFGLPILEAQHYGVPVMTANNSSLPEIAGDAAYLVDPTDVDAIAEAMLRLSQDEALRQQLVEKGYENVKRFSWEKAAKETLAILKRAVGR